MNLLLLDDNEIDDGGCAVLVGRRATHLLNVIGVETGSQLRAGIIRGSRGIATVESVSSDRVVISFDEREAASAAPPLELVLAAPRPKALSRCIQQAVSLGVGGVSLINAWRVDKSYFQSPRLAPDSLMADARLGCEQGGHTWLPEIRIYRRFMVFCDDVEARASSALRLVAHPGGSTSMAHARIDIDKPIMLAIGPEGGWIQRELETLARLEFERVTLSASVLRTETAVVAALSQIELLRSRVSATPTH